MERGLVAEIDLGAISHNFNVVRRMAGGRPVIAVVKADAYGHGAVEVARRLVRDGAGYFAVAFMDEARQLREAGISVPIIVLFDPDVHEGFEHNITPVVGTMKAAAALSREAVKLQRKIAVHVKVDTGMGRIGFRMPADKNIVEIARMPGIIVEGVMSHFSDADLKDPSFALSQIELFGGLRRELAAAGLQIPLYHLANSAAVMTLPESYCDAVRPGLMLYGYPSCSVADSRLIPAMSARARILELRKLPAGTPVSYGRTFVTARESLIAVIAAGYADGFNRLFSNKATVLVRGKRAPVTGRVCMDVTMIDVTDIGDVSEKDDATVMGGQGDARITAAELSEWSGTIPYEIMLAIGSRAKRVYIR